MNEEIQRFVRRMLWVILFFRLGISIWNFGNSKFHSEVYSSYIKDNLEICFITKKFNKDLLWVQFVSERLFQIFERRERLFERLLWQSFQKPITIPNSSIHRIQFVHFDSVSFYFFFHWLALLIWVFKYNSLSKYLKNFIQIYF